MSEAAEELRSIGEEYRARLTMTIRKGGLTTREVETAYRLKKATDNFLKEIIPAHNINRERPL